VNLDDDDLIRESEFYVPGSKIEQPIDSPVGKLGLSICYDIRYPELFRKLSL